MTNGNNRQPGEAEENKKEDPQEDRDEAPQVETEGTTGDPATPPDPD